MQFILKLAVLNTLLYNSLKYTPSIITKLAQAYYIPRFNNLNLQYIALNINAL